MAIRALAGLMAVVFVAAGAAHAAPVALSEADFQPTDALVDFNVVPDETAVGATYAASGVTFSGALFGMDNIGDLSLFPGDGGGGIASNWLYGGGGLQGLSFTVSFADLQTRVGFYLSTLPVQTTSVELFNGAVSLGSLDLAQTSSVVAEFRGFGEASGFDRLVFTTTNEVNGFIAIDDFRFSDRAIAVVPEPATWALMIGGFSLAGAALRRRRLLAA